MPGLDYQKLRSVITIEQVLRLLGFRASRRRGRNARGPCPLHTPSDAGGHCFSVDLERNLFRCFHCGAAGNQLDLWRLAQRRPLYPASLQLCNQLGIQPPWLISPYPQRKLKSRNPVPHSTRRATR